jgi:uncharacterized protein YndB with AHSA1/START domain
MSAEMLAAEVSILIVASLEDTWKAVTNSQALNTWYAPGSTWEIEKLAVGEPIWFIHKSGTTVDGEIEDVDAPYQFRLRWFAMDPFIIDDDVTSFMLAEESYGTRVTMQVYNIYDESLADIKRQPNRKQLEADYGMSLENLKAHLEGQPIPHFEPCMVAG